MTDKSLVKKDESVRPQLFQAATTKQKTQKKILRDVIKKAYDGSMGSLVLQALSSQKATKEELAAIREMITRLEGDKR